MDERDGFYFHRSFRDALYKLPAKDQLPILKAIIDFGLDGGDPEELTPTQNAFYLLVRPVLAKGRNKAANGKKGGSKSEANRKQTESKKGSASGLLLSDKGQGSNPNGLRQGLSDEGKKTSPGDPAAEPAPAIKEGRSFTSFWEDYPNKADRDDAWEAWKQLNPDAKTVQAIKAGLGAWKQSGQWLDDGGRFIPSAAKWLSKRRWECPPAPGKQPIPKGASGKLGQAELEAIQQALARSDPDLPPLEEG
ncbi:MAG: DUF6291 domain-containing protein [Faecousia sp.]